MHLIHSYWISDLIKSKLHDLDTLARIHIEPFSFANGHVVSSMNVQAPQLPSYASILKKLNRKYHVVIGDDQEAPKVCLFLILWRQYN